MDPRQHDVRRHRTDRDCLVLDIGNVVVGWPVVAHQPGVGGHGAKYESVDLVLAEALDYLQPGASRRAAAFGGWANLVALAEGAAGLSLDQRFSPIAQSRPSQRCALPMSRTGRTTAKTAASSGPRKPRVHFSLSSCEYSIRPRISGCLDEYWEVQRPNGIKPDEIPTWLNEHGEVDTQTFIEIG